MSTLNKYIIFQCDTCNRQTELQIPGNRVDPIRCIITNKCRGKLSRVGESAAKKFLFTPPVPGLQDYIQRGTVINPAPVIASVPNASLNTSGGAGMLSMAILRKSASSPYEFSVLAKDGITNVIVDTEVDDSALAQNVKILLNIFPISPSVLQSTTFTYLETGEVQVISGPDNSPESNTLRFTADNNISVYTNGIELDPSAYVISVADQSITFTPAIYEQNNVVNIIVYNNLTANVDQSTIIGLEFDVLDPTINLPPPYISDLAFLNVCAWGNYDAVKFSPTNERYLMHCTDLSALSKDISYGVDSMQVVIGTPVPAPSIIPGTIYTIYFPGNTAWTSIGAANNNVGTVFTATSAGTGTGTATVNVPIDVALSEASLLLAKDPYDFVDKELNAYLNGASFTTSFTFTFSQDQQTGVYKLTAPDTSDPANFTSLLHPLIPTRPTPPTLLAAQSTTGASSVSSNVKHSYIIGPI